MKTQVDIFELVEKAFQEERLTVPMAEIQNRAGRHQARWVPRLAAVIVLAMLAGFFWWQQTHRAHMTTLDTQTQACLRHWAQLAPTLPEHIRLTKPSRVFALGTGGHTAQIYSNGEVLIECVQDGDSTEVGSLWQDGGPTPLSTGREFSHYARLGTFSYLVGEVPEGMTAVKARLANGDEVTAEISGRLFAVWHPRATVEGALLIASNEQGDQRYAGEPTMMGAVWNEPTISAQCRNWMRRHFGEPDLSLNQVYSASTADNELRAYANDRLAVLCTLGRPNRDGSTSSSLNTLGLPDRRPWASLGPLEVVGNGSPPRVFYFGKAPEGATRVEFHLDDGTVVPATLLGSSLFCVIANTRSGLAIPKIVGYTPTRIYTRENSVTTSVPVG